jgi:hypothetical protein
MVLPPFHFTRLRVEMMFNDKLSFWPVVGGLFFIGFAVIVVAAFLAGGPPARRKKRRDAD